jgi:hypothetical protein
VIELGAAADIESIHQRKQDRGVLYVVWPGPAEQVLERSIASLKQVHPELPYHVERLGPGSTLLDKARMYEFSPFRQTLYLDADTVVLGRLDYGFDAAARYGLACCVCECPWASRFTSLRQHHDLIEYNTGVIFFACWTKRLFGRWAATAQELDSALPFMVGDKQAVMPINDQASFAETIRTDFYNPHVLPMNWNLRPQWHKSLFGPVKIWHDYRDVPQGVLDWNQQQMAEGSICQYAELN